MRRRQATCLLPRSSSPLSARYLWRIVRSARKVHMAQDRQVVYTQNTNHAPSKMGREMQPTSVSSLRLPARLAQACFSSGSPELTPPGCGVTVHLR